MKDPRITDGLRTLYLAGPMTGRPKFNFPLFDSVAASLRQHGWEVISPAELDDPSTREAALASPDGAPGSGTANGETYGDFLARDIKLVIDEADGVACLPGWQDSTGACIEAFTARRQGKPLFEVAVAQEGYLAMTEMPEGVAYGRPPTTSQMHGESRIERLRAVANGGEVRITDPDTGGQKGRKPERLDLIPCEALWELGRVYGMGAEKYADHNYLKGYSWSLSIAAAMRHLTQWVNGETLDDESELNHLAHAAWHCFALMMFQWHGLGTDDRMPTVTGIAPDAITRTGRSEAARKSECNCDGDWICGSCLEDNKP
jgi:nucleoside 2-deoxyribosyltransferase